MAQSSDQLINLILSDGCLLVLGELPDTLHHSNEVEVVSDAHGQVSVVVKPLIPGDFAIIVTLCSFKSSQKVFEDLLLALLSIDKVLVMANIINIANVLDTKNARVVSVHVLKGLFDHIQTTFRKWFTKSAEEFLVSNIAITINVVEFHKSLNVNFLWENTICCKCFSKLSNIKLLVAIIVHTSKECSQCSNANTTFLLDFHFELGVQSLNLDVQTNAV
mmetsp:Transcript_88878/g.122730  ORF Transcript_88878/g.122730 Transcript_88878/m.122730 type:complete len:219 (-) Transcript_88878:42-698(-)